jgi:hypothetical protein
MISTLEICESPLETKLVTFFNVREKADGSFAVVSEYKQSIFSNAPLDHPGTAKRLSEKYRLDFYVASNTRIECRIKREFRESLDEFLAKLYISIVSDLARIARNPKLDCEIALAMLGLRGSHDGGSYYAVDARRVNDAYNAQVENLVSRYTALAWVWNFNRRPARSNKADQFRIKVDWIRTNLLAELSGINPYKGSVLKAITR